MAIVNTVYTVKVTSSNADVSLVPSSPDFIMSSLVVANTNEGAATVMVKLADGNGTELAQVVPGEIIPAGESRTLDLRSLNVPASSYQLMVNTSVTGVHFIASGGVKV